MRKLLTYGLMVLGLNACTSLDIASNADFVTTQGFYGQDDTQMIKEKFFGSKGPVRTLGVLTLADFSKAEQDRDPMVFTIKRERSRFFAEKSLYISDNKEKTFFDETLFNFGIDKKKKGMGMELTLKF